MLNPINYKPQSRIQNLQKGMRRLLDGPVVSAPPPAVAETTSIEDAYFNSSLFIIFAALLCTLLLMLVMNFMVRCAIHRCGRRRRQNTEEREEEAVASGTNKKEALHQIPIVAYGGAAAGGVTGTDCAICLGEFVKGKKVRVLPECHHGFHVKCIDTWLALHSTCPTCRRAVAVLVASKGGWPSSSPEVGGATSAAAQQFIVAPELVRGG